MVNEGYTIDHPLGLQGDFAALCAHWSYRRNGAIHIQASESPVWDTCSQSLRSTRRVYPQTGPKFARALEWALSQQVLVPGDWAVKIKNVRPGGWAFQRANNYYPDVDDTAVALRVLGKLRSRIGELRERVERAIELGVEWTLAMQGRNGGWAAFDKDNDKEIVSKIPFCNFGEAIDPPSVDITAHVIEAFAALGYDNGHPAIRRALDYSEANKKKREAGSAAGGSIISTAQLPFCRL